jgi:hypothetical protein
MKKKMLSKKIEFLPSSEQTFETVSVPERSVLSIPEWYKKIKPDCKKNPKFDKQGQLANTNLKMCMPFLDSLTTGYIQKTWQDIYIKRTSDNGVSWHYPKTPSIMNSRSKINIEFYNNEFYDIEFVWKVQWMMKTPKNFSVLITHPLNRMDLPFYTLSGIIDSDLYYHAPDSSLPFYIKKDFEGLIPAGTPMYQILPIKREEWKSIKQKYSIDIYKRYSEQKTYFWEFYKKNMWQRKKYE